MPNRRISVLLVQGDIYANKTLQEIKKKIPSNFWLEDPKCKHVLTLLCHRHNNEFTPTAGKSSNVTRKDQKQARRLDIAKERQVIKERTAMEMKLMRSSSPTRKLELQIKKAVAKEMICKSKVNRENKGVQTIKMKLDLLKESRECLDEDYYKDQVQKLMKEMLSEKKASEDVDGLESSSDDGEKEDSNDNNDNDSDSGDVIEVM